MWGVTVALLGIIITIWLLWRKKRFSVFKECGIPGPEPSIFFGNYPEIAKKNPIVVMKEWADKYGRVYGYFYGASPVLVVTDMEILRKVQISDFQKFINRGRIFELGRKERKPGDGFSSALTNLKDKKWKDVRSAITPSFTTSKMRLMAPIINNTIDSLMENIDDHVKKDESFNIYTLYQGLTMDVIGRTAFGIQTNCQRNPEDPMLKASKLAFDSDVDRLLFYFGFSFPEFAILFELYLAVFFFLYFLGKNPIKDMVNTVKEVVRIRREASASRRQDVLQFLLDAKVTLSELSTSSFQNLTAGDDGAAEKKMDTNEDLKSSASNRALSEGEIIDNSVLFFLAGFETTSTSLAFATHFLMHFPEVQERIRDEVNDLLEKEKKLDYASVQKLQYLDQVLNETIRFYPPIYLFVVREAAEDMTLGEYKIKKGMAIQVPVYTLQHDEEFWPDPETFDPDRFSPETKHLRDPMAFQAFGAGPRNCVGMRFAQMEFKLAMARILHKYRIVKCDKTDSHPISLKFNVATITPQKGIYVRLEPL